MNDKIIELKNRYVPAKFALDHLVDYARKGGGTVAGAHQVLWDFLECAAALTSQPEQLAAEPVKGKNYEQGWWSMRNYEAMLEDGSKAQPVQPAAQQLQEYADARVQADRVARQTDPQPWMQNIDSAMKEPLFHELRALMGTENLGQDVALLQTLRRHRAKSYIAQPVQPATGCACKWNGELSESRCELHEAWHVAILEWSDRAKAAEAKLAQLVQPTQQQSQDALDAARPVTDAMVEAYLVKQREVVEEADKFGRPNAGGLHSNTVKEACRAGITAAIAARGAT